MKYNHAPVVDYLENNVTAFAKWIAQADQTALLLYYIEKGNTYQAAFGLAQISEKQFYDWKKGEPPKEALEAYYTAKKIEKPDDAKSQFSQAVERAEATAENRMLGVIESAATAGDTASAKWWLERRRRTLYGNNTEIIIKEDAEITELKERLRLLDPNEQPRTSAE